MVTCAVSMKSLWFMVNARLRLTAHPKLQCGSGKSISIELLRLRRFQSFNITPSTTALYFSVFKNYVRISTSTNAILLCQLLSSLAIITFFIIVTTVIRSSF